MIMIIGTKKKYLDGLKFLSLRCQQQSFICYITAAWKNDTATTFWNIHLELLNECLHSRASNSIYQLTTLLQLLDIANFANSLDYQ